MDSLDKILDEKSAISDVQVADLYKKNPGVWVLLEALEKNEKGQATKLKVLKYHENKEVLRAYLLDHDTLEELGTLIYFFTGYDGKCHI